MAEESVFRKKSLDRLNTPEELRDYVKVTGVGLWIFLAAVILLLIGVVIWGCFGHLETTVSTGVKVSNGTMYIYLTETDSELVTTDSYVVIDGQNFSIEDTEAVPEEITSTTDSYLTHLANMSTGSWAYVIIGECSLNDGIYKATMVMDSVSPISLIMN